MLSKIHCLPIFMLASTTVAFAQQQAKGVVISGEDQLPVIGASIVVPGTSIGTVTDFNGNFTLDVPSNVTKVIISYVGLETQEVAVSGNMRVVLSANAEELEEVVVVAYGTASKQSITGAVSVVGSKEIENRISSSATAALEGSAPGIQVNNTYGEPGAAPSVMIRGAGTISGTTSPLYVVDGVPFSGNISEINSSDIESMSILKDAASSALYGNRAANGVVLITTKSGKMNSGKPQVTLAANFGAYTRGLEEYERLGANEWMETSWIAMKNFAMSGSLKLDETAASKYASERLVQDYVRRNIYDKGSKELFDANGKLQANILPGYDDLNWADDIERMGFRQDYTVSASTATDKMKIYASAGYLNEKGYIIASDYERFTARLNTVFTPTKWLKTGVNLNGTVAERNYNSNATGDYYANPFYITRFTAPVYPLFMHNADGSYQLDENGEKIYDTTSEYLGNRNIAFELRNNQELSKRNNLNGQVFATITLPFDLSATVRGDFTNSTSNNTGYSNPLIGDGAANGGRLETSVYQYQYYTAQQLLNWGKTFGLHHVDLMAGHENYSYTRNYTAAMDTEMAVDGNFTMGNFLVNSYSEGYNDAYRTESYLARARYNYNDKYFVEGSYRRDGSSRFHPDNRWGDFFSVGASWNITHEDFMQGVDWVDYLKLRASFGEVGNDAGVDYYAYMALYGIDKNANEAALIKQSLSASEIKWETTQTTDVAVEARLFNRLNVQAGYFDKRSKDLLFAVKLPLSAGSAPGETNMTVYKNIGTISNRGVEISADVDVIKTKNFKWNIGADATILRNKILTLPEGKDILSGSYKYSEGHSIYEYFTYHFVGVDQMTGQSLYTLDPAMRDAASEAGHLVNINGTEYSTNTTYGLRDWAGSVLPDVYGSINTSLAYKNWSLAALFTYSLGGKMYDSSYRSLMSTSSASSASANHVDLLESWNGVPEGMEPESPNRIDPNGIPAVDFNRSTYNNGMSDRWLVDASYLVCKNINLSYALPKSYLGNSGISDLRFTAGVENLFTLTSRQGLNPQFSFSGGSDNTYVTARVFNIGLSAKF